MSEYVLTACNAGHRDEGHGCEEDGLPVPQQLRAQGAADGAHVHQHAHPRLVSSLTH